MFCELSDPNSKYADWKIIDIKSLNDLSIDGSNGFYAVMIETGEGQAMVGFRGSESFETWQTEEDWFIADVGLLNSTETKEQQAAREYMAYLQNTYGSKYTEWYTTGHSLGGNLAEHAAITAPEDMNIVHSWSLDGPGVSNEYLDYWSNEIAFRLDVLTHYQWSWVGGLLNRFEIDEFDQYIETEDYDDNFTLDYDNRWIKLKFDENGNYSGCEIGIDEAHYLSSFFFRHDTCFAYLDENGYFIPGEYDSAKETMDWLGNISRNWDSNDSLWARVIDLSVISLLTRDFYIMNLIEYGKEDADRILDDWIRFGAETSGDDAIFAVNAFMKGAIINNYSNEIHAL